MITKDNIAAKVIESGGKLSVKSALNPILWLCAIVSIPSLIISFFITPIPTWLIIMIISPVMCAILGFLFLLMFDRDKLQSEQYQLQKRSMEIIQEKGQTEPQFIDTRKVEAIENPETVEISENKE